MSFKPSDLPDPKNEFQLLCEHMSIEVDAEAETNIVRIIGEKGQVMTTYLTDGHASEYMIIEDGLGGSIRVDRRTLKHMSTWLEELYGPGHGPVVSGDVDELEKVYPGLAGDLTTRIQEVLDGLPPGLTPEDVQARVRAEISGLIPPGSEIHVIAQPMNKTDSEAVSEDADKVLVENW
jgi:hypothetical protein